MAEEKKDLRIRKTQRELAAALLTLLEKISFGNITVNDIFTQAMVSRSAFYAHFDDKYALLRMCADGLMQQLFGGVKESGTPLRWQDVLEKVKENVKIFRNLMLADQDVEVMELTRASFHRGFEALLATHPKMQDGLPGLAEVVSVY